ncbi:hypothetical protein [Aequorivita capsosiphonis]|uniref:hypothetical protein n=1 Tax=Aequorivita capsosiphonis TaxID=487317 RepID=UPI000404D702|nr:hypothetical protein [Aequorivita capsosiphonis]
MAEIKIEKKKPIWPWILIILIILAAIYFFWYYNDNNYNTDDRLMENDTITKIDETNNYNDNEAMESTALYSGTYGTVRDEQAIADYLNFVDIDKNIDQETDNEYYRSAFFKLITATKRESEIKNVDVTENISAAMNNAEMLTNDPATNQKTDKIRMTSENVSKALRKIQQESFSDLLEETNAVETASNNIDARGTIEEDKSDINPFFDKAAILLHKMYQSEETNK